ncbi:patatin-like phospholipase family protein [Rhodopirellula europaea]|uniref:patatin-like phospholipase family protein n=1 Tax=Rhodopirellula europaea TaxID=1263866 RepID=UPI003D27B808
MQPGKTVNTPCRTSILAFDGGGVRGVFQACLVNELHKRTGLLNHVTAFAGTSTGALMAACLAWDIRRIDEAVDLYARIGSDVFTGLKQTPRKLFPFSPNYSADRLAAGLKSFFSCDGSSPEFASCKTRCLVFAISLGTHEVITFDSRFPSPRNLSVIDVLLSSSAAPTYFRPHTFSNRLFVDGGLGCNNPAWPSVNHFVSSGIPIEATKVLSIGTCSRPSSIGLIPPAWRARFMWAVPTINICMDTTSNASNEYCRTMLGDRFLRLDGTSRVRENIPLDAQRLAHKHLIDVAHSVASDRSVIESVEEWLSR